MPEPKGAIVFVHGFRGVAETTWQKFPELLTSGSSKVKAAANYDLYFFQYDSRVEAADSAHFLGSFLNELGTAPGWNIINPSLGSAIGTQNANIRWQSKNFRYEKIIICAHSLGAVVARRALLDRSVPPAAAWLSKVQLLLFAPAHFGAKIIPLFSMTLDGLAVGFGALRISGKVGEVALRSYYKSLDNLAPKSQCLTDLDRDSRARRAANPDSTDWLRANVVRANGDAVVFAGSFVDDHLPHTIIKPSTHIRVCKPQLETDVALTTLLRIL